MDTKGCISFLSELWFVLHIQSVSADCTFDSSFVGSWTSNDYETITVSSSILTLGSHTFNINGKTTSDWTCHDNSTEPYVILRSEIFELYKSESVAYICMEATTVNNNSYYFYMNSPKNIFIGSERIHIFGTASNSTGNATEICTETPSKAEFISIVRTG
ncbi:uncharacterized protein LOC134705914 [Mytilus trossulus]|uniref:uncharacterized protein LOC134705914 n=1 Tax=Mytilus trossulus TaxID=6551 RepID=UPI003005247F